MTVIHGDKNEKKIAYLRTKKECGQWLTLQPGLKSVKIHFYGTHSSEKDVSLDGKYSIDQWVSKNG